MKGETGMVNGWAEKDGVSQSKWGSVAIQVARLEESAMIK